MGTLRKTGFIHFLLGSVAENVSGIQRGKFSQFRKFLSFQLIRCTFLILLCPNLLIVRRKIKQSSIWPHMLMSRCLAPKVRLPEVKAALSVKKNHRDVFRYETEMCL